MIEFADWLFGAILLVALVSLLLLFQGRLIYFPRRYSKAELDEARTSGTQEIRFRTSGGNQVAFFWQRENSETAPQNVWLLFGGNGDLALAWLRLLRAFPGQSTGYLLIDYPGYGICDGRPNPRTILENSECALQTLLEIKGWKVGAEHLGVLGHSLGGAAALQFAARNTVGRILLVSTFTRMDDMVREQIRIPLGRLLRHRFDNVASLKAILLQNDVPKICIFHGQADEIIPLKMGRALAKLEPSRIHFVEIAGSGHNDILQMPLPLSLQSALFGAVVAE
jgi:pimeloyl-ACP methyl ester carboxylesterase